MYNFTTMDKGRWTIAAALAMLLVSTTTVRAGLLDFQTIENAKAAYQAGEYDKAAKLYGSISSKNDEARFNHANALYKLKKYKPSIEEYSNISDKSLLKPQALYNAGNAHAQLGELDQAESAYENALKVARDPELIDAINNNLEIIKKEKKKQQNKQKNKDQQKQDQQKKNGQDKQNDQNKNGQNKQNDQKQQGNKDQKDRQDKQNDSQNKQKRDQQQQPSEQGQSSSKANEKQQSQSAAQKEKEQQEKIEQQQRKMQQQAAAKAQPISDMEERKYNQMLNKRGIKTLMVPLKGKGEPKHDETTPW